VKVAIAGGAGTPVVAQLRALLPAHGHQLTDHCGDADAVLFASAPDDAEGIVPGQAIEEERRAALGRLLASTPRLRRLVYFSSTGVYARTDGRIDEEAAWDPRTRSDRAHALAEGLLWRRLRGCDDGGADGAVRPEIVVLRIAPLDGSGEGGGGGATRAAIRHVVSAREVAAAAVFVLERSEAAGRAFNVAATQTPVVGAVYDTTKLRALGFELSLALPPAGTSPTATADAERAPFGFQFAELMTGDWTPADGERRRFFQFAVNSRAPRLGTFLRDGRMSCDGWIQADGLADDRPCAGTLVMPVRSRYVRIDLAFHGDDGRPYRYRAEKKLTVLHLVRDITTFLGQLEDADGRTIGQSIARFDLRSDVPRLLASVRLRDVARDSAPVLSPTTGRRFPRLLNVPPTE
jgi:hypothetical protein